jgi:hypothetical protein
MSAAARAPARPGGTGRLRLDGAARARPRAPGGSSALALGARLLWVSRLERLAPIPEDTPRSRKDPGSRLRCVGRCGRATGCARLAAFGQRRSPEAARAHARTRESRPVSAVVPVVPQPRAETMVDLAGFTFQVIDQAGQTVGDPSPQIRPVMPCLGGCPRALTSSCGNCHHHRPSRRLRVPSVGSPASNPDPIASSPSRCRTSLGFCGARIPGGRK